jgi:Arc/MetJ-type ribon-helix-helix transcriptional regulator
MPTSIKLTAAQEAWLEAQVAEGHVPSAEDAVRSAVADLMTLSNDDLSWAKPYVEAARASVARGETVEAQDILLRLRRHIADFKSA